MAKPKIKFSIIIPHYGKHLEDLLKPCIESIYKYTDMKNVEIVVVANGCTDDVKGYCKTKKKINLIWFDEGMGFTKATNEGIKVSKGEYLILLNNDTELLEQPKNQWIDFLYAPFKDKKKTGITGPLKLHDDYADHGTMIFFCVMIPKKLFDELGLLDEIFSPGGGEDIDFCVRAVKAGYSLEEVPVPHWFDEKDKENTGYLRIWHKDNKTFGDIPEYSRKIVKRNGLVNCKRYNKNIKLDLGSGGIVREGYLSVDLYDNRANIIMDATKLEFEDNSVSEILASHLFEHLNPYKVWDILTEWKRVLKPGGKLIMEMPDIEALCKRFVIANKQERYGILNAVYGSVNTTDSGDPSAITAPHLFGWWPETVYDHLAGVGFKDIQFMPEQIFHPESNFRVTAIK